MCGKILSLLLLLALSWALPAQEFTPVYENLDRLSGLIESELSLNGDMIRDNESLKSALNTLSELLREQGKLLGEQEQNSLKERAISARQAELLTRYIGRSRNLTIGLIVAVPAAVGAGTLIGWGLATDWGRK
jgi:hypothetical protein